MSYSCRTIPEKTATYSAHIIEAELDDRRSEEAIEASELSRSTLVDARVHSNAVGEGEELL